LSDSNEREEENKEFMLKLYNGEVEFDETDVTDEELSDSDDDKEEEVDESNIANLLNTFDRTERELIQEYEKENLGSQRVEQFSQTSE
jgi:Ran GTPase-activating protein (RanGAP) involved in mRNA processing and transport